MNRTTFRNLHNFGLHEVADQYSRRFFLAAAARCAAGLGLLAVLPLTFAEGATTVAAQARTSALAFDAATGVLFELRPDALLRSDDRGSHWTSLDLPWASATRHLSSVAVSAEDEKAIYVADAGLGVLRSDDQGRSWAARNEGLPGLEVAALATHADRPETVYAYLREKGIFRSEDGGGSWRLMDAGPRGGISSFFHSNMAGSMQSGWLFVAGPRGVQRSMDCFCGWRDAGGLGHAVSAVAYDPKAPADIYAATADGIFASSDGGEKWTPSQSPPIAIEALVVTTRRELVAAGADHHVYTRAAAGASWRRLDA
jgi:photosystem II stability/assembly factor-like uncharacterized protein